ncbi:Eco29kI family restriction endonuclease [Parafannyhessea umbonata]
MPRFEGSGIHALYYTGEFAPYEPIAKANRKESGSWPIYVAKGEA